MKFQLEQFLKRRGDVLFAIYFLLGGLFLCLYRTLHNANFAFAFAFLGAPILLLSLYVYFFKMPRFRAKEGPIKGPFLTLFVSFLLISVSAGYVSFANAVGPGKRHIVFQGTIAELNALQHRRGMSYHVVLVNKNGKSITLPVTRAEYSALAVGQQYSARWKVGSLGMLYR